MPQSNEVLQSLQIIGPFYEEVSEEEAESKGVSKEQSTTDEIPANKEEVESDTGEDEEDYYDSFDVRDLETEVERSEVIRPKIAKVGPDVEQLQRTVDRLHGDIQAILRQLNTLEDQLKMHLTSGGVDIILLSLPL